MYNSNFPSNSPPNSRGATPTPSQQTSRHAATGLIHAGGTQPVNSQPAKGEALQEAIREYISKLSNDDKAAFQSAPNIIERLQEMQYTSKSPISSTLTARVERVLQCVKHFMGSLTIFIQQSPEISSLVVGGVNCILTLLLGYIEFFERLTGMMERIGAHLSYLTEYSKATFQDSGKLQKALAAAYCDLLEFYIKARRVFSKKKGKRSYVQGFKLFFKLTWEPFEAQFDSIETRFSDHTLAVVRLGNVDYQNRTLKYQDEMRKLDERKEENETRRKILKWLSPDDFEETYERHFKKRHNNTGKWLLDDHSFKDWRDGKKSSLLWCHGAPGSGKTILATLVIEHLSELYELSTGTGITFVYCNYMESRTTTTYIRLALKQLCRTMQSLPLELQEVYDKHYKNDSQPKYDELRKIFLEIIQQLGQVFFVVDALDECTPDERKNLCKFLLSITHTGTSQGTVKLFATSRKEPDIELAFRQQVIPTIEIEATKVDSDIKIYVKAQTELRLREGSLSIRNEAMKDKIISALTTKAGGMFLWVEFQLNAICVEHSDNGIERALARVPKDMDATYERILNIINNMSQTQRELARRALIWTAYAREPLPIDDLAQIISIEGDTKSLEDLKASIPTEKDILNACGNLISVDRSPRRSVRFVRFIHFSVQEFLTRHQSEYIEALGMGCEAAHREIAQTCMIYLTLFPKRRDFLGLYTCKEWPHHLLAGNLNSLRVDDPIVTLTLSFFASNPMMLLKQPLLLEEPLHLKEVYLKFLLPVLVLMFDLPGMRPLHEKREEKQYSKTIEDPDLGCMILSDDNLAMHYAVAELDSVPIARRLHNYGYTVDYSYCAPGEECSKLPDLLQISSLYSVQSIQMARFLLTNGISTEPQQLRDTLIDPLEYFVTRGNLGVGVLQLLLNSSVGQNSKRFWLALQAAVRETNVDAIQLLLHKGADGNIQGGNTLETAVWMGNVEVIRLLMDTRASIDTQGGRYGRALQAAVFDDNIELIQLLLDKGADVNMHDQECGNALQAAVCADNVEVIQLLLDNRADVNIQGGEYGSTLQAAAWVGNIDVIRLLLDRGADVNIQGGKNGSALQAAVCGGNVDIIRLLLDRGADVNMQGGEYGNVLQAAVCDDNVEVIRLLLDAGADVNIQGGEYGSTLQAAAWVGNINVIRLLLDRGADINIQGGENGSALQAAACGGHVKVARMLLKKGADIDMQGGKYGSALQSAVVDNHEDIIRLLLDKGASVNIQGGEYGNSLQAAAWRGNVEVVRLLLYRGADVHARGGIYGTALQAAFAPCSRDGSQKRPAQILPVVELLLDFGADMTTYVPGSRYGNALTAANIMWKQDWYSLDALLKLIASRAREGDAGGDEPKEGISGNNMDGLETSHEHESKSTSENHVEGTKTPDASGLETSNRDRFRVLVHLWKPFGFAFMALLLYAWIQFWI